jgi:hypothetical protein
MVLKTWAVKWQVKPDGRRAIVFFVIINADIAWLFSAAADGFCL